MSKPNPQIGMALILAAALCGAARAQAVVEYGGIAGASATGAAANRKTGKQVGGVWSSLEKTLKSSPDQSGSQNASPRQTRRRASARPNKADAAETPAAAAIHEDPRQIQPGIAYEELIRRCGPPSFEVATGPTTKTLAYPGKDSGIDVELQDGKVVRVAAAKPQAIADGAPK